MVNAEIELAYCGMTGGVKWFCKYMQAIMTRYELAVMQQY